MIRACSRVDLPDPVRPGRRAAWLGEGCRYLSATAQRPIYAASYFDINQMRLDTWTWRKVAAGRWSAVSVVGPDTAAIGAVRTMGASTRFGGTGACPP